MRAVIVPLVALAGLVGLVAPAHATPAVPHHEITVAAPAITTGAPALRRRNAPGKRMARQSRCLARSVRTQALAADPSIGALRPIA